MHICDGLLREYAAGRGFAFAWETVKAERWVADVSLGAPTASRAWWRAEGDTEQEALNRASDRAIAFWRAAGRSG
ncbi:MAG: hypothetical protein DI547_09360 [Sphingobium sp.]|jgi:hypothetical protein|nr:MAG: hypothetical protein DI547_09360 [Sphingobium sp.]